MWPQKPLLTTGKCFSHEKNEKKGPNFLGTLLPILRLTFLESSSKFRKFGFKKMMGIFFRFHGSSGPMCQEQSILFFVFSLLQSVPPDLNYLISHCIPTFVRIGLLVQVEKALVLGVTLIDKCLWHQKWRYIWQRYCDKPSCDQTTSFCDSNWNSYCMFQNISISLFLEKSLSLWTILY